MKLKPTGHKLKVRAKKLAYKDLLFQYRLLQDLMRFIPDVIYFKDAKGRLLLVNDAHAKGLGLKPEEVIGKTDFDIFPKAKAKKMWEDDLYVMKTGKPIIDKIERATRADGVDNYVSTTKIPRYDDKDNIIGIIGITRDITKRIYLEHLREQRLRVEKKIKALEEINRTKSEFISIVSHELRTPLAIAKEAIMLIFDRIAGPISEKQEKLLARARNSIERLKKMTDELLDLSRIENSQFKLRYSLVNLNDLLQDSADFFKKLAQEKSINLQYCLPKSQANIFLDFERINQVASNLITNAIRYTEAHGKIIVELKVFESKVRLGVIDTGMGIHKNDVPKLFNRFVQVSKTPEAQKGVGLGLAISKDLIEKHGGEIWVESKPGVGSKFYFTLPRFYTQNLLERNIREKINELLVKNIPVYLFNVHIINYKAFKAKIKIEPVKLFADLTAIMKRQMEKLSGARTYKPQLIFSDTKYGKCSIIYPQANERIAEKICDAAKEEIQKYISQYKAGNIFINVGMLPYFSEAKASLSHELLANLYFRRLYIGSEIRRFQRIRYKAYFDIITSHGLKEPSSTVDISEGGLCFISAKPLKTDSTIALKLKLFGSKTLNLKGRVAWIKEAQEPSKAHVFSYMVGVEFIHLGPVQRRILRNFLKPLAS